MHPAACLATYWAMAAYEQGKFEEFAEQVFTNMNTMIPREGALQQKLAVATANMRRYAQQIGLDVNRASSFVARRGYQLRLGKDLREASEAGVSGTPAMFINGRSYKGAMMASKIKEVVGDLLAGKI
jgi:predicted DsbA family dithiol-disulfide isomerase